MATKKSEQNSKRKKNSINVSAYIRKHLEESADEIREGLAKLGKKTSNRSIHSIRSSVKKKKSEQETVSTEKQAAPALAKQKEKRPESFSMERKIPPPSFREQLDLEIEKTEELLEVLTKLRGLLGVEEL